AVVPPSLSPPVFLSLSFSSSLSLSHFPFIPPLYLSPSFSPPLPLFLCLPLSLPLSIYPPLYLSPLFLSPSPLSLSLSPPSLLHVMVILCTTVIIPSVFSSCFHCHDYNVPITEC